MKIWLQVDLRNMQASTLAASPENFPVSLRYIWQAEFPEKVLKVCHAHVLCLWCAFK